MRAVISLLRGVNVGGNRKINMEQLRALYESLGLERAKTFIQSGNVIFVTNEKNLTRLATRIEDAIEREFGFRSTVVLRTAADLRSVKDRNPFAAREGIEPNKLLVTFLVGDPPAEARALLGKLKVGPEELHLAGRELYIYFPNGMGKSKLPLPAIERALQVTGTGRNWNSVLKMLDLAEKMEAD